MSAFPSRANWSRFHAMPCLYSAVEVVQPAGTLPARLTPQVFDGGPAFEEGEVGMVGASLLADAGPGRLGLILVFDVVEEKEVRDHPFAKRPNMLPSQRPIRLVTADCGCRLVFVSMEVENRVKV